MKNIDATEQAYKNGYEQGKKDALKWISVKDRLPEVAWRVLVTDGTNVNFGYTLCFEIKGVSPWCTLSPVMPDKVTHWMPLPEPPKGE